MKAILSVVLLFVWGVASQSALASSTQATTLTQSPPSLCGSDLIALQLNWSCINGSWFATGDQVIDVDRTNGTAALHFSSPLIVNGSLNIVSAATTIVCSGYHLTGDLPLFTVTGTAKKIDISCVFHIKEKIDHSCTGNASLRGSLIIVLNATASTIKKFPYPVLVGMFGSLTQPFKSVTVVSSSACVTYDQSDPYYRSSDSSFGLLLKYASNPCAIRKRWVIATCTGNYYSTDLRPTMSKFCHSCRCIDRNFDSHCWWLVLAKKRNRKTAVFRKKRRSNVKLQKTLLSY